MISRLVEKNQIFILKVRFEEKIDFEECATTDSTSS